MKKAPGSKKKLGASESESLLKILESRFQKNMHRHEGVNWSEVRERLEKNSKTLWSINEMERTGGEPDLVLIEGKKGDLIFFDCAPESPKGRRSVCYDHEALEARKEHKPGNSAIGMAEDMGIEVLTEGQYVALQKVVKMDTKTSSWLRTPSEVRALGGAIFGDWRYGRVFIYHNGAESYYGVRGFRGFIAL